MEMKNTKSHDALEVPYRSDGRKERCKKKKHSWLGTVKTPRGMGGAIERPKWPPENIRKEKRELWGGRGRNVLRGGDWTILIKSRVMGLAGRECRRGMASTEGPNWKRGETESSVRCSMLKA